MKRMMKTSERISNVKSALWFAQRKVPRYVMQETGMAVYDAVKAIIPALLVSLAFVTLTTVVGAGAGAAVGSLGAGVGAVPLGVAGGSIGFKAGLWILNIVGLAFLIEYMRGSLWEATRHIEAGVRRAWGPTEKYPYYPYDGDVFGASEEIALGAAIVIRCILEGIVLYLTVKGVSRLPELIANLKRSKFGETFAVWVEQNYEQMLSNPKLTRRVGTGTAKDQPARVLTDHATMQEQPRPGQTKKELPPLRQKYVDDVAKLKDKANTMKKEGYSDEEIARILHDERNALKVQYRELTPSNVLKKIETRNIQKYGDKIGPSVDQLKESGKSWSDIIDSATRTGGKDLGF
jgi:hypothetical protein